MRGSRRLLPAVLGAFLILSPPEAVQSQGTAPLNRISSSPVETGHRATLDVFPGLALYPDDSPSRIFVTPRGEIREAVVPAGAGRLHSQSIQPQLPGPGRTFLLSALLPGLGQRVMGQDRWIAYLAGEAWAWIQFFQRRREGHSLQDRYRDLAWLVARRVSSGPRVDGDFEYYEALIQFASSGAYDADPGVSGLQPEEDPETFNGSIWMLASQIFFLDDPEEPVGEDSDQYQEALRYYRSRAYTQDFAWNWGSNSLQQGEFGALIRASDENLRRSTTMVGVILANHLLSAVDALVSSRLGQVSPPEARLQLSLRPGPFYQDTFFLTIRIPSH